MVFVFLYLWRFICQDLFRDNAFNNKDLYNQRSNNYSNSITDIKYKLVKQVSEDTLYSKDKEKVKTLIKK